MSRIIHSLAKLLTFSFTVLPATAAELQLQPVAVPIFARVAYKEHDKNLFMVTAIPLGKSAAALANAKPVPVKVWAYGSEGDIQVLLDPIDPKADMNKAGLACTAMSEAYAWWRFVNLDGDEDKRPVRASIYYEGNGSEELDVLLAEAVFQPQLDKSRRFAYPGPAWLRVAAVDKVGDAKTIRYIQELQMQLYTWKQTERRKNPKQSAGDPQDKATREEMRGLLTSEQDEEISNKMNIAPGTVKLHDMLLTPLATLD
jgi:hypothetical protein